MAGAPFAGACRGGLDGEGPEFSHGARRRRGAAPVGLHGEGRRRTLRRSLGDQQPMGMRGLRVRGCGAGCCVRRGLQRSALGTWACNSGVSDSALGFYWARSENPLPGLCLKGVFGGGGGLWDPKFCVQKMA